MICNQIHCERNKLDSNIVLLHDIRNQLVFKCEFLKALVLNCKHYSLTFVLREISSFFLPL